MTETPKYTERDVVYLKESAALGFLEAVTISGVMKNNGKWLYTINVSAAPMTTLYGDKRSLVHGNTLYFSEDEFVLMCDALDLAEAHAQRVLDKVKAQKAMFCNQTE